MECQETYNKIFFMYDYGNLNKNAIITNADNECKSDI